MWYSVSVCDSLCDTGEALQGPVKDRLVSQGQLLREGRHSGDVQGWAVSSCRALEHTAGLGTGIQGWILDELSLPAQSPQQPLVVTRWRGRLRVLVLSTDLVCAFWECWLGPAAAGTGSHEAAVASPLWDTPSLLVFLVERA